MQSLLDEHQKQQRFAESRKEEVPGYGGWLVSLPDLVYAQCCPCLVGRDMCDHLGASGFKGCICSIVCPFCFLWDVAPKMARLSGVDAECVCMNLLCFGHCFVCSVYTEYMWQKRRGMGANQPVASLAPIKLPSGKE